MKTDLAHDIASKFEHLVGEGDADGMTGLQLLSCNPGAFRREGCKGEFPKQIIDSSSFLSNLYPVIVVCIVFSDLRVPRCLLFLMLVGNGCQFRSLSMLIANEFC